MCVAPDFLQHKPKPFKGALGIRTRIAAIIRWACGVAYHPRHVGRIRDARRWRPQKPARRARQRNAAAMAPCPAGFRPSMKTCMLRASR